MDLLWIIVIVIVVSIVPLLYFEEGKKIGRREERKRWENIEGAEKSAAYCDKKGDASAAANWRAFAEKLRLEGGSVA